MAKNWEYRGHQMFFKCFEVGVGVVWAGMAIARIVPTNGWIVVEAFDCDPVVVERAVNVLLGRV